MNISPKESRESGSLRLSGNPQLILIIETPKEGK